MLKLRIPTVILLLFSIHFHLLAQEAEQITGKILNSEKQALANVQISSPGASVSASSDANGEFTITVRNKNSMLKVETPGYYTAKIYLNGRQNVEVILLPVNTLYRSANEISAGDITLNKKDLNMGYASPEESLAGLIPGLQVIGKSGIPGEGSYINMRGFHSFTGENTPLIIVDGMPYLPDLNESPMINAYSRNIFMPLNLKEIENITISRNYNAGIYGSLASNGVINIQTEKAIDLETKVEFQTVNGISWLDKRIPLMDDKAFKNYIGDIGETAINDLNQLIERFPFLKNDPDYHYNYLYDNNTDWQKEIYRPAFSTENILKVKGGDAVANYAISVGIMQNKGILDNTDMTKYFTRLNANMAITPKLRMFASTGFTFNDANIMEQGLAMQTNPYLTALSRSPLLSIYQKNSAGSYLPIFEGISPFGISNPVALLSDVNAQSKAYNVLVNAGLDWDVTSKISLHTLLGLYYNYTSENLFVPGRDYDAIAPMKDGLAQNLVRSGIGESFNFYWNANASYNETFNYIHNLNILLGFQMMTTNHEFDSGEGINTSSDFFRTLGNVNTGYGRTINGYINKWNWMNFYLKTGYDFKGVLSTGMTLTLDGSSSSGERDGYFKLYPGAYVSVNLKNHAILRNVNAINALSLDAAYSVTANSRFSSRFGKYYYENKRYRDVSGSVRAGIPNSQLEAERTHTRNLALNFATLSNKLNITTEVFDERTRKMVLPSKAAPVFGFGEIYDNSATIKTQGIDFSIQASLIRSKDFEWIIGGNISHYKSKIVHLGNVNERITDFADGSAVISKVGKSPYSFYGYQMEGVISTYEEAEKLNLLTANRQPFTAGDALFTDFNSDGYINDKDRTILGDANPDFQGGFFTHFRYKNINLSAHFIYSYGNDIYNGIRRIIESPSDFGNKSTAVEKRWVSEGQITDIPKAQYGDPKANNRFSSRWIEDGSFLKLKNVTLSYNFRENFLFFREAQVYVSAENLFTVTKYLGMDPEFAYNYNPILLGFDLGKVATPRTMKLGIKLNF